MKKKSVRGMNKHEMSTDGQGKGCRSQDSTTDSRIKGKVIKSGDSGRGGRQGIINFGADLGIKTLKVPGNRRTK